MSIDYIIVQAGGKGSRMEKLTRNKPKALVPINNLPMIFHLFKKFPNKKFIIIGDYKYEVLKSYLNAFAQVDYQLVKATGHEGTCAGLAEALTFIPESEGFMLTWCDLVLPAEYKLPNNQANYIGISKDFPCRWKYENGEFSEEKNTKHGVAGHFIFKSKSEIEDVPQEGEFVRWLRKKKLQFIELALSKTKEYGLISEWNKIPTMRCRPFNEIIIDENKLIKRGIDEQGLSLAKREIAWYQKMQDHHFENLPRIFSFEPLTMEKIEGKNIYEYSDIPSESKKRILQQIVDCLKQVHAIESIPSDFDSYYDAYIGKTFNRLSKIQSLVPFANNEFVVVNGKKCRNIFFYKDDVVKLVNQYFPKEFQLIHGDCTFSNMMLREDSVPVLIDPRGYFGTTELYGDAAYDWVKLYYSLYSNYDQFNLKQFDLTIMEQEIELSIKSNKWEDLEEYFFELLDGEVTKKQMKLLLAIIWLSLTTYAWEDYDSICGAFYNGLLYLEEALK